jgi:hypothetical protein
MNTTLTPLQIGLLADLVLQAVTKFPMKPKSWQEMVKESEDEAIRMDPWEVNLKEEVNKRPDALPNYESLQEDHMDILEYLVNYYTESVELPDNLAEEESQSLTNQR